MGVHSSGGLFLPVSIASAKAWSSEVRASHSALIMVSGIGPPGTVVLLTWFLSLFYKPSALSFVISSSIIRRTVLCLCLDIRQISMYYQNMNKTRDPWKGSTAVLILASLAEMPRHGYAIARDIEKRSDALISLGEGSLYPALMNLEQQGLIRGDWETPPPGGGPARKVYTLTESGHQTLAKRAPEVRALAEAITSLLKGIKDVAPSPV